VLGAAQAKNVLSDPTKPLEAAIVAATSNADADRIRAIRPWLFAGAMDVVPALRSAS
jgi:hypothetical protein